MRHISFLYVARKQRIVKKEGSPVSTMTRIKPYAGAVVLGLTAVGLLVYTGNVRDELETAETQLVAYEKELAAIRATDAELSKPLDTDAAADTIETRTVSAEKVAKEIIAVDDTLTQFFKMNEVIEDKAARDKFFKSVDIAKQENTRLTGASEADHIDTWKKNPEWTTKLETVVAYEDAPTVPVVFSMTTKDGDTAGLVFATYNAQSGTIDGVSKLYTRAGILDESAVGGR